MHPKMHLCALYTHLNPSHVHHQLAQLACTWLTHYDTKVHSKKNHSHNICKFSLALVDMMSSLVHTLTEDNHTMLTMVAFMYTERFLRKAGITHDSIVNVCIVSTMLAVKYWDDCLDVTNAEIAEMAGLDIVYLNKIERIFLNQVGYNLSISSRDMNTFCYQLVNEDYN